jgi:hypothetical protein
MGLDPAHQFPLDIDDDNVSVETYRFLPYLDLATNARSWLRQRRMRLAHPSYYPALYLWRYQQRGTCAC